MRSKSSLRRGGSAGGPPGGADTGGGGVAPPGGAGGGGGGAAAGSPTRWPNSWAAVSPTVVSAGLVASAFAVGPTYQLPASSRTIGGGCSSIVWSSPELTHTGSNTTARRRGPSRWNLLFQRLAIPSLQIFLWAAVAAHPLNLILTRTRSSVRE